MQAVQAGQAGLVEKLQGMWCDAVPLLTVWEWGHARHAITASQNASTSTAVQAWLQVDLVPQLIHVQILAVVAIVNMLHVHPFALGADCLPHLLLALMPLQFSPAIA